MARVFFDLSDMFDHFLVSDSLSGIQRFALECCAVAVQEKVRFCAYSRATGTILEIPGAVIADRARSLALFSSGDPGLPPVTAGTHSKPASVSGSAAAALHVRKRLELAWRRIAFLSGQGLPGSITLPLDFQAGDRVALLGLPNDRLRALTLYQRLGKNGVRLFTFCHDTIPLTQSQYSHRSTVLQYRQYFPRAVTAAHTVFCNSKATEADVRTSIRQLNLAERPTKVIPLAHEFLGQGSHREAFTAGEPRAESVRALMGKPYVLCVGTVEIRKNHERLARVWQRLAAEHGDQLPPLVIAGRRGWKNEGFYRLMHETRWLDGKIIQVGGISDDDLAWLYSNCLFSVFPSLFEGWGLPIGESAWFGRPCVTSNVSSMPEVLGDHGLYCDPSSDDSLAAAVRPLLTDERALQAAVDKVRSMPLRTWRNVAEDLLTEVRA